MSDDLALLRADAVRTLSHVLHWELTPARWELLGGMLDALDAATAEADALAAATADLQLAGPMRITPIGAPRVERRPAPPEVRERVNELMHVLRGGEPAGADPRTRTDPTRDTEDGRR
jgi:hypothetical protein